MINLAAFLWNTYRAPLQVSHTYVVWHKRRRAIIVPALFLTVDLGSSILHFLYIPFTNNLCSAHSIMLVFSPSSPNPSWSMLVMRSGLIVLASASWGLNIICTGNAGSLLVLCTITLICSTHEGMIAYKIRHVGKMMSGASSLAANQNKRLTRNILFESGS